MRLLRRYAPRNDNDRMSLPAKRSNLNDCTEQDHFILLEALSHFISLISRKFPCFLVDLPAGAWYHTNEKLRENAMLADLERAELVFDMGKV
ncbi:MAG: hypothetical protein ACE5NM_13030 [Sedimentisphaerales bacterium]